MEIKFAPITCGRNNFIVLPVGQENKWLMLSDDGMRRH